MNESVISKTSEYFKRSGIILPKISKLCNPDSIDENIKNSPELIFKQIKRNKQ